MSGTRRWHARDGVTYRWNYFVAVTSKFLILERDVAFVYQLCDHCRRHCIRCCALSPVQVQAAIGLSERKNGLTRR